MMTPCWIFCNACGRRFLREWHRIIGREVKVCSIECVRALELVRARSILGEPDAPGFRMSAHLWFRTAGKKIANDLARREMIEESEEWWLLTGGKMSR